MLVKLRAIVLHSFPYGDNSVIVKCFTDELGLQSYLVNGVKNKKGVLRPSMIFPLTCLNLVAYHKNKGKLERIKEAKMASSYQTINFDPVKNAMALFIAEILLKVINEEQPNKQLYQFLEHRLHLLDATDVSLKLYHIHFLLDLSFYMGFRPLVPDNDGGFFDMLEGHFIPHAPAHPYYMNEEESKLLAAALDHKDIETTKETRLKLLDDLLIYYRLQIESFGNVKSLEVLKELF